MRTSNSKRCVSVKKGSNCLTGFPLLLSTVHPVPPQFSDRIVELDRTAPDAHVELEAMRVGEEGLELSDGLSLVVEHRPAGADPVLRSDRRTGSDCPRCARRTRSDACR